VVKIKQRLEIQEINGLRYLESGQGEPLVLLHGLFGALSNFDSVTEHFSKKYKVFIPVMPIYDVSVKEADLESLVSFVAQFVEAKALKNLILLGNSLGGHVALIYSLRYTDQVKKLILTGSSGLFEDGMGGSYPKRGNYEFVKERVGYTFYDPNVATKELVDEVFEVTRSIPKCLRMVSYARSAQRHNMAGVIHAIKIPTLLIWGLNDTITPPQVAHEFHKLLPNSTLRFLDKCGHAPMMEHPEKFNRIVDEFLLKNP
jgi:pimeloyl-ACP methyl ester carboxylesterase